MSLYKQIINYKFSKRHIAKTFSWRFFATTDTIILSFIITGNLFGGVKLGSFEVITKMILYYIHERLWFKSNFRNRKSRHLFKTFSWRFVGTIDTVLLSLLIFGDIDLAFQIGLFETLTKMILYFLHEKFWFRINYGLENRESKISKFLVRTKIRKNG